MRMVTAICVLLVFALSGTAQEIIPDSVVNALSKYAYAYNRFGQVLPQEKVYLHFDNTSYYAGDAIWFQSYVVNPGLNTPTGLSKTLYVELLNPGGEIIAKQILAIDNGRSDGSFKLDHLPFYSGFYEVRAYTKYMLNFAEDLIFSRIIPVFEKPAIEGNFVEKNIKRQTKYKYPQNRKLEKKAKKVNLKFYPEGGSCVEGVSSRVAFEATDAYGNPLEVSGVVVNKKGTTQCVFATLHEGKGVFSYIPNGERCKAVVTIDSKNYDFDLPDPLKQGYVLRVDNLLDSDSVQIQVQKNAQTPAAVLGLVMVGHGRLSNYCLVNVENEDAVCFKLPKRNMDSGVQQIILFDMNGEIVADRLIFEREKALLSIHVEKNKDYYLPYDSVRLEFAVKDAKGTPSVAPLSVSVRDGKEEVSSRCSLLADLLLMSEIKGYVRNPFYYFESNDSVRNNALDLLLMVQGWRRYDWNGWSNMTHANVKYMPEQGIEVHGQVVSMVRSKPKPNVQVSLFLAKPAEEDSIPQTSAFDIFETDSLGHFSFTTKTHGKCNMILSVMEKGKMKDHRIILDRVFSPEPKVYSLAEMQVEVDNVRAAAEKIDNYLADTMIVEDQSYEQFMKRYEDSLSRRGVREKIHRLSEVVVKAKKRDRAQEVFEARSKSIAYYDVASEIDDVKDRNKYIGNDIHELVMNINSNFYRVYSKGDEYLKYKGSLPLFVINYETTEATEMDYNKYKLINLEAIKSIYINEEFSTKCRYADPRISPMDIDDLYSCVVLIETFPEGEIPVKGGKGVRKTWLEGYSQVKEFYQPDYTVLPKEEDYRRTLYWNPELVPDENGVAVVSFFNNSSCKQLKITAETISEDGRIGVYTE
ncbi:MAG: hypothetical protein ACRDD6_14805 [Tannerellaceae bacterium]